MCHSNELVNMYRNAAICVKADVYGNHSYDTMGQLACGRPMVCANTEGCADMIENGKNGFLFVKRKTTPACGACRSAPLRPRSLQNDWNEREKNH